MRGRHRNQCTQQLTISIQWHQGSRRAEGAWWADHTINDQSREQQSGEDTEPASRF